MSITGPSRLILIRAGKYDYAEVDLSRPLHLVGPNNVGKTSLVATLQLLYVDDKSHMHFSRSLEESLRYYFPDHSSYVLFEVLTPTGFMVVGMQGQGPLRQYDFQRFVYTGRYDQKDYIDSNKMRSPDDVLARLASRGYTLLEPKSLRAALTGGMEDNEMDFGLVPIRHKNDYARFRGLFCNLLRLSHLRQEELKRLFCDIYRDQFHQREVDLQKSGYADRYSTVVNQLGELRHLKAIENDARRLLGLAEKRNELRCLLPDLWVALIAESEREDRKLAGEIEVASQKVANLTAERNAWDKRRQDADRARLEISKKQGALTEKIQQHEEQAAEFASYLEDFEQARLRELESRFEDVSARLHSVTGDSTERLRREVENLSAQIAHRNSLLASIEHNVASEVRNALSDAEAFSVFRLLNPALLGLAVRDGVVRVKNHKKTKDALKGLAKQLAGDVYEDDAVVVHLNALKDPRIGDYSDPARIQGEIAELEDLLKRTEAALKDAEQMEALRVERDALRSEKDALASKAERYRLYQQSRSTADSWRADLKDVEHQIADLNGQCQEADRCKDALTADISNTATTEKELTALRNRFQKRVRDLQKPPSEWPMTGNPVTVESLDALIDHYRNIASQEAGLSQQLSDELSSVHIQGYQYEAGGENERLALLAEHLEGLSEREKAVDELWRTLVTDLGYAFKALLRDVETLQMQVEELNRHLDGVNVSNLERLHLHFVERSEVTASLRKVVMDDELTLFADKSETNQAREQIKEMLQRHSSIQLFDLFDLGFKVTTPDGRTQSYPHLDRIESNGTSITIKVLIHMILIRGLLNDRRDVTIPFYLDEAASLDQENLNGIVTQALRLGFVPILASPDPMEVADNLYFLREQEGRISMRPQSQMRLRPDSTQQN